MFWFKKEKEYKNKIEELQSEIEKLNDVKWNLMLENCRLGCERKLFEIKNERLENFVTEIEKALKKLKGEE